MRIFKITITTILLLMVAAIALWGLQSILPTGMGPDERALEDYHEDDHHHEELPEDVYSKQLKKYEGVIKPLGVSIYGEGTHRLEEDDKLVVILESAKMKLDDFEEKEVTVRGFVRDTTQGSQKIMDVQYLEVLSEAGVKLFNEVGYEFSFSYPSDWQTNKELDKVTFFRERADKPETLVVVYQYEDVGQDLDTWLQDRDQNLFYEETSVRVGQLTGVRRTVENGSQKIIKSYVKEGKNAYELRLVSQDEVIRNQYFSIVDYFQTQFVDEEEDKKAEKEEEVEKPAEKKEESADDKETALGSEADDARARGEVTKEPEEEVEEKAPEKEEEPAEEAEDDAELGKNDDTKSFSNLDPLSDSAIERVLEKGFSTFEGRSLSFLYPKVWYFEYLGDGQYGFTDQATYQEAGDSVTVSNSRVLIVTGESDVSCSYQKVESIDSTNYIVCAREPGLNEVVDKIAGSITK